MLKKLKNKKPNNIYIIASSIMSFEEKLWGFLYGSALGDALGAPVEFSNIDFIKEKYGSKGIQEPPDSAIWTDDTQMMIYLAEGVLQTYDTDVSTTMESISKSFVAWLDDMGLAPGMTCRRGAVALENGVHWSKSGIKESKGCGSAMRSGILGLLYHNNAMKMQEIAKYSGLATHAHSTADASSQAAAFLVNYAFNGIDPVKYPSMLLNDVGGIADEFDDIIIYVSEVFQEDVTPPEALAMIGQGWVGEEAIALALYCVLKNPYDYKACVRMAVNITGDSDSVGCIAGGIMGTYLGKQAIPTEWIAKLREKERLDVLGNKIIKILNISNKLK